MEKAKSIKDVLGDFEKKDVREKLHLVLNNKGKVIVPDSVSGKKNRNNITEIFSNEIPFPKKRRGSISFYDVPINNKMKDWSSPAANLLKINLPPTIVADLWHVFINNAMRSKQAGRLLRYMLKNSQITRFVHDDYSNPRVFKNIYKLELPEDTIDYFFINADGAKAICSRLELIYSLLPKIVREERIFFNLKDDEPYLIDNVGAGYALDTIFALLLNKDLRNKIHVRCIDPDRDSMLLAKEIVANLDLESNFEFCNTSVEKVPPRQTHLQMWIGMFCPAPSGLMKKTLIAMHNNGYIRENGLLMVSTVLEKMVENGPLLDLIMWLAGWCMHFKKTGETEKIVQEAGFNPVPRFSDRDEFGYNLVITARKN